MFWNLAYVVALLALFGETISSVTPIISKAKLANILEFPEIISTTRDDHLSWFQDHLHLIDDKVFFLGTLMSELEKKEFGEDSSVFAVYCIKTYFSMVEEDKRKFAGSNSLLHCVKILLEKRDFETLMNFTVLFGVEMLKLLFDTERVDLIESFTASLWHFIDREAFFKILRDIGESRIEFKYKIFGYFIISKEIPEGFYIKELELNSELALNSAVTAFSLCLIERPLDIIKVHKVFSILHKISNNNRSVLDLIDSFKVAVKIIRLPDNITSAASGIDFKRFTMVQRNANIVNALNFGKKILFEELFKTLSNEEKKEFLIGCFASAKFFPTSLLKIPSQVYKQLPEYLRKTVHETDFYLNAAIDFLKLEKVETFSEGEYKYKLTFKASDEQVLRLGYLEEMTFYAKNFNYYGIFASNIKFMSAESIENLLSHNLPNFFVEPLSSNFYINKDTMNLIAKSNHLIRFLSENGYKIKMKEADFASFIEETPLENIPTMNYLIRDTLISKMTISLFKEKESFRKLEKITGLSIADIIIIASNLSEITQSDYFMIRNALVYLMKGPGSPRLNDLPNGLKMNLIKEFPYLSGFVVIN